MVERHAHSAFTACELENVRVFRAIQSNFQDVDRIPSVRAQKAAAPGANVGSIPS